MDIKTTRTAMGLSATDLAEKLGVHFTTIYRMESGDIRVSKRTAMAIRALAKSMRVKLPEAEL